MVNANAAEERKSAKTGDARRMHFARARKGQYRDKVERITYRIPSVHTEKENGKCHVARAAVGGGVGSGGTNARKREPRKIREHAFTCVENLERYREGGRTAATR